MMPQEIMMVILDTAQHLYDLGRWVKVQAETIPKVYELVRKKLQVIFKCRKRDYDLKFVDNCYDVGDYVYKIDFTLRSG